MQKNYALIIMCVALLATLFTACDKDFLTVVNPNEMTVDSFWRNGEDVEAALTATYAMLQHQWWSEYWGPGEAFACLESLSDLTNHTSFNPIDATSQYEADPNHYSVYYFWEHNYKMVYAANQILKYVPGITTLTDEEKNEFLGEAHFLRAYAHFQLLTLYGNIVLVTDVPVTPEDFYQVQVAPEAVWAQIEEDLTFAKNNLPTDYADAWSGRATKGAATAYLGKAYLFQEKWSEAETEFKAVTNMGYGLVNDIYSLFNGLNEFSEESIFEVNYTADVTGGRSEATSINPWFDAWLGLWPTDHLKGLFMDDTTANGEPSARTFASIVFNHPNSDVYYFEGQTFEEYYGADENRVFYKKYSYTDDTDNWYAEIGTNYLVMRYSDVLLMLAEALNEQGKTAEAIPYVNQVRNRAGSVPIDAGMSQTDLQHHIREVERPLELCNEMGRFFDIVRWYKDTAGGVKAILEANGRNYADNFENGKDEIWPLPVEEVDANPNVVQNPGY